MSFRWLQAWTALTIAVAGCDRSPPPAATQPSAAVTAEPSVAAPAEPSAVLTAQPAPHPSAPLTLPPKLAGPVEADDDPKVRADAVGICAQISNGRHSAFGAMAVFTKRWRQLTWLYERGDREGTCKIAELIRAAHQRDPDGPCTDRLVRSFEAHCKHPVESP